MPLRRGTTIVFCIGSSDHASAPNSANTCRASLLNGPILDRRAREINDVAADGALAQGVQHLVPAVHFHTDADTQRGVERVRSRVRSACLLPIEKGSLLFH